MVGWKPWKHCHLLTHWLGQFCLPVVALLMIQRQFDYPCLMIPDVVWVSIVASKGITKLFWEFGNDICTSSHLVWAYKWKVQSGMESTHRCLYEFTNCPFKGKTWGFIPDFILFNVLNTSVFTDKKYNDRWIQ